MNQIEQTLTSMEVAEMVEKDHSKLLRDIRTYIEQLNEAKIGLVEFFNESSYKDTKGENRPCFLVTKKGCEFIAHKLTGVKGTVFTAKYINRFHELETQLKVPQTTSGQIQLLAQGYTDLEKKIDRIENDMPLFGAESDELSAHVKRRGAFLLGGKNSEAYKDKTLRKKVFTDIYSQLKREFGLYDIEGHSKSYKALKRKSLADAHEFIDCYELPRCLQEEIRDCNTQLRFEAV